MGEGKQEPGKPKRWAWRVALWLVFGAMLLWFALGLVLAALKYALALAALGALGYLMYRWPRRFCSTVRGLLASHGDENPGVVGPGADTSGPKGPRQ